MIFLAAYAFQAAIAQQSQHQIDRAQYWGQYCLAFSVSAFWDRAIHVVSWSNELLSTGGTRWPTFLLLYFLSSKLEPFVWELIFREPVRPCEHVLSQDHVFRDISDLVQHFKFNSVESVSLSVLQYFLAEADSKRVDAMSSQVLARENVDMAQMGAVKTFAAGPASMMACAAPLFYQLDQLGCSNEIKVQTGKPPVVARFFLPPWRDFVADQIRARQDTGCNVDFQAAAELASLVSEQGAVLVDVGSHLGQCLVWACAALSQRLLAYVAVEPQPENAGLLMRSLTAAQDDGNCPAAELRLESVALGPTHGQVQLATGVGSGAISRVLGDDGEVPEGVLLPRTTVVSQVRLDDLWIKSSLGPTSIDVLKISVAGNEAEVLRGASALLEQKLVRTILMHFPRRFRKLSEARSHMEGLFEPLLSTNYTLWFKGHEIRSIDDVLTTSAGKEGALVARAPMA